MVPIRVGGRYGVEMVLDTGSAVSTISQGVRVALADLGLLESREETATSCARWRSKDSACPTCACAKAAA
jgi:hypothetical protein